MKRDKFNRYSTTLRYFNTIVETLNAIITAQCFRENWQYMSEKPDGCPRHDYMSIVEPIYEF